MSVPEVAIVDCSVKKNDNYQPSYCAVSDFFEIIEFIFSHLRGWSGGAMGLSKLPVPRRPTI